MPIKSTRHPSMTMIRTLALLPLLLLQLTASLLPAAATTAPRAHFEQWKALHGKSYQPGAEEDRRYGHWLAQFERVRRHNDDNHHHQSAYQLGLNEFADLSPEEHQRRFLAGGFVPQGWRAALDPTHPRVFNGDSADPPPAVDWRTPALNPKGVKAVTPVRNQAYWYVGLD